MNEFITFPNPNHHCDKPCNTGEHNWTETANEEEHCSHCPEQSYDIKLVAKYEVCPTCFGKGTRVNPAIDGNGLTSSDIDELGPDFMEDYMSGVYDIKCSECNGNRVILVPDEAQNSEENLKAYEDYQYELYADERTRMAESGYYSGY
jgi:hypothetical protein